MRQLQIARERFLELGAKSDFCRQCVTNKNQRN